MSTVKFEKSVIYECRDNYKYYWFSAGFFIDGVLKFGEGCAFSDKKRVNEIKNKFRMLTK
jgi:hypothetical protein